MGLGFTVSHVAYVHEFFLGLDQEQGGQQEQGVPSCPELSTGEATP